MIMIMLGNGDAVTENTVEVAAAGGIGFSHKCQLPKLKAELR